MKCARTRNWRKLLRQFNLQSINCKSRSMTPSCKLGAKRMLQRAPFMLSARLRLRRRLCELHPTTSASDSGANRGLPRPPNLQCRLRPRQPRRPPREALPFNSHEARLNLVSWLFFCLERTINTEGRRTNDQRRPTNREARCFVRLGPSLNRERCSSVHHRRPMKSHPRESNSQAPQFIWQPRLSIPRARSLNSRASQKKGRARRIAEDDWQFGEPPRHLKRRASVPKRRRRPMNRRPRRLNRCRCLQKVSR